MSKESQKSGLSVSLSLSLQNLYLFELIKKTEGIEKIVLKNPTYEERKICQGLTKKLERQNEADSEEEKAEATQEQKKKVLPVKIAAESTNYNYKHQMPFKNRHFTSIFFKHFQADLKILQSTYSVRIQPVRGALEISSFQAELSDFFRRDMINKMNSLIFFTSKNIHVNTKTIFSPLIQQSLSKQSIFYQLVRIQNKDVVIFYAVDSMNRAESAKYSDGANKLAKLNRSSLMNKVANICCRYSAWINATAEPFIITDKIKKFTRHSKVIEALFKVIHREIALISKECHMVIETIPSIACIIAHAQDKCFQEDMKKIVKEVLCQGFLINFAVQNKQDTKKIVQELKYLSKDWVEIVDSENQISFAIKITNIINGELACLLNNLQVLAKNYEAELLLTHYHNYQYRARMHKFLKEKVELFQLTVLNQKQFLNSPNRVASLCISYPERAQESRSFARFILEALKVAIINYNDVILAGKYKYTISVPIQVISLGKEVIEQPKPLKISAKNSVTLSYTYKQPKTQQLAEGIMVLSTARRMYEMEEKLNTYFKRKTKVRSLIYSCKINLLKEEEVRGQIYFCKVPSSISSEEGRLLINDVEIEDIQALTESKEGGQFWGIITNRDKTEYLPVFSFTFLKEQ